MGLSPWVRTHLISIQWLAIVLVEVSFKHVLYFEVQYFTKLSSRALSASKLERVCSALALARDTALERGEDSSANNLSFSTTSSLDNSLKLKVNFL